jgi:DNA polymerase
MIYLDFETRSQCDIKKRGTWNYSRHPSTEVLVMCWAVDGGQVQTFIPEVWDGCPPPAGWLELVNSGQPFTAHNSFFEMSIYYNVCVFRWGWPVIPWVRWRCSLSVCSYRALPRALEAAAIVMKLTAKKDMTGNRVMLKLSKPRKATKTKKDLFHSAPADFQTLNEYCAKDVETTRELCSRIGTLPPDELKVWQLDQVINSRGVMCDVVGIKGALKIIAALDMEYTNQLKRATMGEVSSTGQVKELVAWCGRMGVTLENLQAETVERVLEDGGTMEFNTTTGGFDSVPIPAVVKEVLTIRKNASKSSTKKFMTMLGLASADDARIRSLLIYHGAATGRWSGKGIQIQNFPRGTFKFKSDKNPTAPDFETVLECVRRGDIEAVKRYGSPGEILSSLLRSFLIAAPGKKFVAADYSAIEARVLLWFVGDEKGLGVFRAGGDIYVDMASTIFGVPMNEITDDQRFLGKQAILGLGYQMGFKRFMEQCAGYGKPIPEALARMVVKTYRARFDRVVSMWASVNQAAIHAAATGQPVKCGMVTFQMDGEWLNCVLPSGRAVQYCHPHFVPSRFNPDEASLAYWAVDSQSQKWVEVTTYGGMLVENIVQAISADILRHATINLEYARMPVVLSVHDELVVEVDDTPAVDVKTVENIMCVLPHWAAGLPLESKGWEGKRFKK